MAFKNILDKIFRGDTRASSVPLPKSLETTTRERASLRACYDDLYQYWERRRHQEGVPQELTEEFVLVRSMRSSALDAPDCYFEYLNKYGWLRVNFWVVERKKKILLVSEDLYTLGRDGNTRGKGSAALMQGDRFFQDLADESGYHVLDVATPNQKSAPLLAEAGYQSFGPKEEKVLSRLAATAPQGRTAKFRETTDGAPAFVKYFYPHPENLKTSASGMDTESVIRLANLKKDA